MELLTPETLKTVVVSFSLLISVIVFTIGAKNKWFSSFSFGKLHFQANEKEAEKQFQSGNFNKVCDDQILRLDSELIDFALEQSNKLRRTLNIHLNRQVNCASTRRSLASCLRYPLWEAARKNHFRDVLRPENIKPYIERLLKEVIEEYQTFALEKEMSYCDVNNNIKCNDLPPLDEVLEMLKKEITESWALPIRRKTYEICDKKIKNYQSFLPSYKDLGDTVRVKVCEACIEKNEGYKKALSRKPEAGEL